MNRKKTITAISAAVMTGILLTGCGTPGAAPSADGAAPEPQPCAFFVKDMAASEWVPITVSEALSVNSSCVPVWILDQYLTPEESAQFVQDHFGIELVSERTVDGRSVTDLTPAGLALGGLTDGISTMDMAAAYSVFARGGEYVKPTLYTLVTRNGGEALLERNTPQTTRVIKEETAAAMTALLKETVTDSTGRMAGFAGQEVAGVPGISASRKDFWFVGYTPEYTAAIWSGYASHEQVTLPQNPSVRLWRQMMEGVFDKL